MRQSRNIAHYQKNLVDYEEMPVASECGGKLRYLEKFDFLEENMETGDRYGAKDWE